MKPLTVLVVDDSAVMRQVTARVLSREPDISVVPAADPLIAMEKMARARPDVILLDLEMPRMDGLTFLRQIMRESPLPVVVCSGHASAGSSAALQALEAGAVDVVAKPLCGVREFLEESAVLLADTLRGAAEAGVRRRFRPAPFVAPLLPRSGIQQRCSLVAIGASTGGTEAIAAVLRSMPVTCPPIVIAQHMPAGFTAAFARRLDSECAIAVKEAEDGDALLPGTALVAPGGRHLLVRRRAGGGYSAEVADGPLVSRHRPSVDVLFRSVAAVGSGALGVLLTGMGADGAQGLRELRAAGGGSIAEHESTCVVFGMPKAAIELGAAEEILPLPQIAAAILRRSAEPA